MVVISISKKTTVLTSIKIQDFELSSKFFIRGGEKFNNKQPQTILKFEQIIDSKIPCKMIPFIAFTSKIKSVSAEHHHSHGDDTINDGMQSLQKFSF